MRRTDYKTTFIVMALLITNPLYPLCGILYEDMKNKIVISNSNKKKSTFFIISSIKLTLF